MKWVDIVTQVRYSSPRSLAKLMSIMWQVAADSGDLALLSNLSMNIMDCNGIASCIDWAGYPPPDDIILLIGAS